MIAIIKNDHDDKTLQPILKSSTSFIGQLKLLASSQITECWRQQMEVKDLTSQIIQNNYIYNII